jgi:hypothetical protein
MRLGLNKCLDFFMKSAASRFSSLASAPTAKHLHLRTNPVLSMYKRANTLRAWASSLFKLMCRWQHIFIPHFHQARPIEHLTGLFPSTTDRACAKSHGFHENHSWMDITSFPSVLEIRSPCTHQVYVLATLREVCSLHASAKLKEYIHAYLHYHPREHISIKKDVRR